jgi:hypothetical protein
VLADHAPRWQLDQPLVPQLLAASKARDRAGLPELISALHTSRPGQAGQILRATMYRLLGIPEPARAVPISPVPVPKQVTS